MKSTEKLKLHLGNTTVPLIGTSVVAHILRRYAPFLVLLISIYGFYEVWEILMYKQPTIIVITPTHRRPERLADMTRLSQTLSQIKNLHWIVIEDGNYTVDNVERILKRSRLPYVYLSTTTQPGLPKKGWTHRNLGLAYIRRNYHNYDHPGVVYFADDDNTYDVRLFDRYIRKVQTIGVWAVGLSGGALVETPRVINGIVVSWDVVFKSERKFAVDMAGFAVNLDLILKSRANFHRGCIRTAPESCFLEQFGISMTEIEPYGYNDSPKEILVWHTKTRNTGTLGGKHGYVIEETSGEKQNEKDDVFTITCKHFFDCLSKFYGSTKRH